MLKQHIHMFNLKCANILKLWLYQNNFLVNLSLAIGIGILVRENYDQDINYAVHTSNV